MYNVKYMNAKQTKIVHSFNKIKEKLIKLYVAAWFSKICDTTS